MSIDIILDLFVITCLAVTIFFAVRLNQRLSTIYKSRDDLQAFLNQFSTSMEKADAGIKDLRGIGESVFKTAQEQMKTAEALKSDLEFLNERGEDIAQKLDRSIREARQYITYMQDQMPSQNQTHPISPKEAFHKPSGEQTGNPPSQQKSMPQNFRQHELHQKRAANESQISHEQRTTPTADVVQHLQNIR